MRVREKVSSGTWKLFQKPHMKVDDGEKTGVKVTVMEGNRNQGIVIIGEIILMLLYTRFVMGVGREFQG